MNRFAALVSQLEETTKTARKTQALTQYMFTARIKIDCGTWHFFLAGPRPKHAVTTSQLREWAAEPSGLPRWLLEETYSVVGDLAETIALVLPEGDTETDRSLSGWTDELRLLTTCNINRGLL
jgi:DNA ligase-1